MTENKKCYAQTRKEWRQWLKRNHEREKRVALVKFKRHTNKPALSHKESMDEAICFGWIDTTIKRIDEDRYERRFAKRTKKSRWSKATQSYARLLIKEGRMTEAGMKAFQDGLKKPVIDHGLPKNPATPNNLKKALAKNKKAEAFFKSLAPSYRRYYIYMVEKAKRPETKKKRIKEIVQKCKENKKPGQ